MNSVKSTLSYSEISSIVDTIASSATSTEEIVRRLIEAGLNRKDFGVHGPMGEHAVVVYKQPTWDDDILWYTSEE